jgi:kynurenine formamidase
MSRFVDLSHIFEDGMPGFRMPGADGQIVQCTARVRPFVTHEQSRANYGGQAEFELTEMSFQTSIGTYLDSPYVRYREGRDIAALDIAELVLPGLVVDLADAAAGDPVGLDRFEAALAGRAVAGHAVLCRFAWDRFWRSDSYYRYPFLARPVLRFLVEGGARLVGVDSINIDDGGDPARPAHSWLLEREIFIVENLCNLAALPAGEPFRLFAVPIRTRGAGSMPIRAFAELSA